MGKPCPEQTKRKISEAHKKRGTKPPGTKGRHYKMSDEWKQKISESLKGEKSPWYGKKLSKEHAAKLTPFKKGNIPWNKGLGTKSSENEKARKTKKAQDWRKAVFERDNYTCQFCKQRGGRLNADHIKRFADYPELRFEISNGRTLCEDCHKTTDTYGWKPYNKSKSTAVNFKSTTIDKIPGWDKDVILNLIK